MTIAEIKKNAETKMGQSIEALKNNLSRIRTGRASPQLLDVIHVEYYGSMVPLSQVANLSLLDARTISVQPWEKNMSAKIEKAIRESDLGLNPASMGDLIRVPMPPMSEERRKEMTSWHAMKAKPPRLLCAICVAMPTKPSSAWSRTRRLRETIRSALKLTSRS